MQEAQTETQPVLASPGHGMQAPRWKTGPLSWLLLGLVVLFVAVWWWPKSLAMQALPHYLPLHVFTETLSLAAAFMAFGIVWGSYRPDQPGNLMILGCALLAAGIVDFAHLLSFPGMPDLITLAGTEKTINFWLAARLITALGLCAAAVRPWSPFSSPAVRSRLLIASLAVALLVYWVGFYHAGCLPRTFIEGRSLTAFKVNAEYAIIALLLVAAVVFLIKARRPQPYDATGFAAAAVVAMLGELSFTLYSAVTDVFNLLGHVYKIVAYVLIYRAVSASSEIQVSHDLWRVKHSPYLVSTLMALVAAAIFAIDLNTPLGVSEHLAYSLIVLLSLWLPRAAHAYIAAAASTGLIVLGFMFSPPGGIVWISLVNRPLSILAVWGVAVVVVLLKRYQHALQQTLNGQERKIAQRTAQLEAANKDLESFSYSVSHDLRTPLRAIDGFSRILLEEYDTKLDDEGRRLLNVVRDNTVKMSQLIDDILLFSRAGRQELVLAEVDMEELVQAVWGELAPTLGARSVRFEAKALPPACGDHSALTQVMTNLLANAIKFTQPRDSAVIEVGGSEAEGESVYYVKDNGVGFDMQYAHKLFNVFQRLHGQDEFEGTGIGLAIVKRIVGKHGGHVWAEGRVNEGANFFFALPRRESCEGGNP